MVEKENTTEPILSNRIKLRSILSAYADLWTDVLYNKNLGSHLEKVNADISYLRILIQLYNRDNIHLLIQIKNDLIDLRVIILLKIQRSAPLNTHKHFLV